ncbi:glycosyltransferase family 2 protein [Oscillospiraceae bacterium N12]|jgi:glycosyltransferase involved in cell wall biosynthesis|uniref:Glycosyltransferase family 2 protein n=1 Tax=Jilunia laotingensis TaxID=2763675 RepID=A0A926EY72_9BACT|nr:glycosyltransferase family 2 protein [Jilunia laotingensis]MBC8592098.1 glycosyltransferase family 2 protein [Jilunia laotingensis]
MRITLIQTAGNRRNELIRFISTLHLQLHDASFDIEYIFVDQADNRDLFVDIEKRLHFVYIKTDKCSLSHARNLAIPKITGDIVSFPDDDCWYPKNLLKKVIDVFMDNIYDGVTGVVTNENGIKYNKYPVSSKELSRNNLCGASSICMFLKYDKSLTFDENIGVGSKYGIGSGEESDYLIRYMGKNHKVLFTPLLIVHHPIHALSRTDKYLQKTYLYAIGTGYIAKKNHLNMLYIFSLLFRPSLGILLFLLKADFYMAKRSLSILRGRIKGLATPIIK